MKRAIEAEAGGVDQLRIEDVSLFEGYIGSTGGISDEDIVRWIRLCGIGKVVRVASENTISIGKEMIQAGSSKVFRGNVRRGERVDSGIAIINDGGIRDVGQTPQ